MNTKFEPGNARYERTIPPYFPDRWATFLTQVIAGWITIIVTAAITLVVIFLVLAGGLWLAYTYLPANIFAIILAVLIVDILLGIALRFFLSRR